MTSRLRRLVKRLVARRTATSRPADAVRDRATTRRRTDQPALVAFTATDSSARLSISSTAVPAGEPILVLVGRKSRLEIAVSMAEQPPGWVALVDDDDLGVFGTETVDVFVGSGADGGLRTRRRLASGGALPSQVGAVRRWYSTAEGNVSVRQPTAAEVIAEAGVFDERFYREQVPDLPVGVDPIQHYVSQGAANGLDPSSMFDTHYYKAMNPTIRRRNPLAHFCDSGWKELRNPSPDFNTWWYWSKHLDPTTESTNPLAHFEAVGRFEGLSTRPDPLPSRSFGPGQRLHGDRSVRRVCLFAGYDPDGIVDDYVVDYVRELSTYADVYYLADSPMPDSELAKLAGITREAWGRRHGEYDFGSYSRLAELVGWETIEQYDELLLVNDSCYLLRPLDEVFAAMDGRECDWWGLQATKGIFPTRHLPVNQFRDPIPMQAVRTTLVDGFEQDYTYDFHLGSYFLAYRKPVIHDPEFRRYLGTVVSQSSKLNVVLKYEIGLTHWLIQHGHPFDTFAPRLYPFHGAFTQWYLRLLDEGYPLLKRRLLAENPFGVPHLSSWPQLITQRVPQADVGSIERNLVRVSDPARLRRSLNIGESVVAVEQPVPDRLLDREELAAADGRSPKHADWWVFPLGDRTGTFTGSIRAVFEQVKDDPSVRKIVLTRRDGLAVDGVNVEVVPLDSPLGQHRLMGAGTILVPCHREPDQTLQVSGELHNLVLVRESATVDQIGYARTRQPRELDAITREQAPFRAVISSSKVDALAMTAAFYPLTFHQVWNTGLPRNDFILRDEGRLPADLRAELDRLRSLVGGRRLLLFMPAFRDAQGEGCYRFLPEEIAWLDHWLTGNNYVLGVREHAAESAQTYSAQLACLPILDLSDAEFSHPEMLYRESAALITDYSSAFIDYLLTGKPTIGFADDYGAHERERDSFYSLDLVFPGPLCKNFTELRAGLEGLLTAAPDEAYEFRTNLFFDHVDDGSSARVVEKIRDLTSVHGIGKRFHERIA